jgi:gliding motility-associated lipoprotein GldH
VYNRYQSINRKEWEKEEEYFFTFDIIDATAAYDLSIDIRNTNFYPYRNLWLFVREEQPFGAFHRDTMECLLADEYGRWYGKGISLFESSFPLRTRHYFPRPGRYTLGVRHGMRTGKLTGIQDIGLRITTSPPAPSP